MMEVKRSSVRPNMHYMEDEKVSVYYDKDSDEVIIACWPYDDISMTKARAQTLCCMIQTLTNNQSHIKSSL